MNVDQFRSGVPLASLADRLGASEAARPSQLDLDSLVVPRTQPGPAFDMPIEQIIDFLVATGDALDLDQNAHLQRGVEELVQLSDLPRVIVEQAFRDLSNYFDRTLLEFVVEQEVGAAYLDGWVPVVDPHGRRSHVRAFPPRLVHVLAGNGPGVAARSITWGALVKGINLFKLPSNDPVSMPVILRTMMDVDAKHPVLRSMSAAYWRGGDSDVEGKIFRAQYFDRLVVWGGHDSIMNAVRHLAPGLQLVSFDPKVSISFIGHEAFESEQTLRDVADAAASDATQFNQDACLASRYQFVEGTDADVDRYCEYLIAALGVDRPYSTAVATNVPSDLAENVDPLRLLSPDYRVWGRCDGRGIVVRSPEPVDFHPAGKTVNVIPVGRLDDALARVTVATQTVGIFPADQRTSLRDQIMALGGQRVVPLGSAHVLLNGLPHDAMYPLQRFVRWVCDEGQTATQ